MVGRAKFHVQVLEIKTEEQVLIKVVIKNYVIFSLKRMRSLWITFIVILVLSASVATAIPQAGGSDNVSVRIFNPFFIFHIFIH